MLELDKDLGKSKTPIITTIATKGAGIPDLVDKTVELITAIDSRSGWKEEQIKVELIGLVEKEVVNRIKKTWEKNGGLDNAVKQVANREKDPYSIVQEIMTPLLKLLPEE
jgi:LAO/AO transport system kinase